MLLVWISILVTLGLAKEVPSENSNSTTQTPPITTPTLATTPRTQPQVQQSQVQRLRGVLLAHHDKEVHPVTNHSDAVPVNLGMTLMHIDIDESRSVLKVDSWLQISWVNQFLTWEPADYDGLDMVHFSAEEIWKPDIVLYNSAEVHKIDLPAVRVLVYSNGRVLWVPPAHFESFCKLDMRYWPVDKQRCQLKFGSWTSHGEDISLDLYDNNTKVDKMQIYTDNREWKVLGSPTAEKFAVKYPCCPEKYEYIDFKFELQRDSPAYRSVIILPCLVLMLTTGCSFLLTPGSGEKLLVSGIALLGTILYLIYFASTLPFHQSSVPIIVTFYSNTCGLIGIAILLNCLCLKISRERKFTKPPKFLTRTFSGFLGKLLCLGNYTHQVSHTHQRLTLELSNIDNEDNVSSYADASQAGTEPGPTANGGSRQSRNHLPDTFQQSTNFVEDRGSIIMQDWTMVAAGLERMFFLIYALAFAIVTSVYV